MHAKAFRPNTLHRVAVKCECYWLCNKIRRCPNGSPIINAVGVACPLQRFLRTQDGHWVHMVKGVICFCERNFFTIVGFNETLSLCNEETGR